MTVLVVAVAQLVESRIVIPVVVGSSPISHPIISLLSQFIASRTLFRVKQKNRPMPVFLFLPLFP